MTPVKKATRKKAAPPKRAASSRKKAVSSSARGVTEEHKAAMLAGRQEGAAIRKYLEALKIENGPKRRGRRRTPEAMLARIAVIDELIADGVDPLNEVMLRQERLLLTSDLQDREPKPSADQFKNDFVKAVKPYSERKGIAYDVWREIGVPVVVLREAGMTPSGRS